MWRFLVRDPILRVAVLLLAATVILALVPGFPGHGALVLSLQIAFLALVLGDLVAQLRAVREQVERLFWLYLLAALAVLVLRLELEPLTLVFGGEAISRLKLDALTLLAHLPILLAAEVRPDLERRLGIRDLGRGIGVLGTLLFLLGLYLYLCVVPSQLDAAGYAAGAYSWPLYLLPGGYLVLRFAYLAQVSPVPRWRTLHLLLAVVLLAVDGYAALRAAGRAPELPFESASDLPYLVALLPLLVSTRLRRFIFPSGGVERLAATLVPEAMPVRFTVRLIIYAMMLPFLHLMQYGLGWIDSIDQRPQEILLLFQLASLGGLAVLLYRSVEEKSRALLNQRYRAEARLRLLDKAFETIRLGITVTDLSGTILYVNPAQARMHGYAGEELIGQASSLLGPRDLRRPMHPDEVTRVRSWSRDSVNVRRDGTRFPVQLISDLVRDAGGDPIAIVTTCEDITERKRIEDALRQSERDYRGLFEYAHDAILIFRPDDEVVLDVNPSACDLYGYRRQDFLGMSLETINANVSYGKQQIQEVLWKGDFHTYETQHYRRDRSTMHMEIRAALLEYRGQLAILSINRDITDRKRTEEVLRATNEELRTFVSLVSHDLRAPLVNLKGFTQELRSSLEEIGPAVELGVKHLNDSGRRSALLAMEEDVPEAMDFIDSAVDRMDYFIEALLKLSRAGRRDLELEPLDMESLVKEVLGTLSYQISQAGAEVTVSELPPIIADRVSMAQIMGNLLSNAVTYLQPGRPGSIQVYGERGDHDMTFSVRDNGRGIEGDDLEKVFQPFRRCGSPEVAGEGMGLAYVQALVRRQGGRLWCESTPGVGSVFSFTISAHLEEENIEVLSDQ